MTEIFELIADVGAPHRTIGNGVFYYLVIKQIMEGIVEQVKRLTCKGLETRATTMSNEMMKIDLLVSSALN